LDINTTTVKQGKYDEVLKDIGVPGKPATVDGGFQFAYKQQRSPTTVPHMGMIGSDESGRPRDGQRNEMDPMRFKANPPEISTPTTKSTRKGTWDSREHY